MRERKAQITTIQSEGDTITNLQYIKITQHYCNILEMQQKRKNSWVNSAYR